VRDLSAQTMGIGITSLPPSRRRVETGAGSRLSGSFALPQDLVPPPVKLCRHPPRSSHNDADPRHPASPLKVGKGDRITAVPGLAVFRAGDCGCLSPSILPTSLGATVPRSTLSSRGHRFRDSWCRCLTVSIRDRIDSLYRVRIPSPLDPELVLFSNDVADQSRIWKGVVGN